MSAHANARQYYGQKKQSAVKQQKTLNMSAHALKQAEAKAKRALNKVAKTTPGMALVRKPFWFEKFHWFISSEHFLIIAGRDAHQNEVCIHSHQCRANIFLRPGHSDANRLS